ncbi:MAG: hypothetical protein ACOZE5_00855 [Verrucomicrobiota bacterium]
MGKPASLTHPGIILREEFFEPLGITQLSAAKAAYDLRGVERACGTALARVHPAEQAA